MPKCVECGKDMAMGYTIIENKIYCPDCAEKHPLVVEANRMREKEEAARGVVAEALWEIATKGQKSITFGPEDEPKELTKDEFIEIVKRRPLFR